MSESLPTPEGDATPHTAAWEPPSLEDMGRQLPQYEFVDVLGKGGMGVVYKARQITLDRFVALKVLPPGVQDDEIDFRERFITEARSMARLSHPGIVHVHDFGATPDGLMYFVMEYVEGTNVEAVLHEKGRMPPKLAVHLLGQICDALAYAHNHHLIHRDVKPSNMLVDNDGRIRVADFGLAQEDRGSVSGATMGTPEYAAPELTREGAIIDHRVDIYALGVMLYQMLTGQVPTGEFLPASHASDEIDSKFDAIILKAMSWDVGSRYDSAEAIKRDMLAIVEPGQPKSEADLPKKKELPPFQNTPSKKRGVPGMVAVLPVLAVVGLVALTVSIVNNRRGDQSGPEPKREAPPVFGNAPVKPLPDAPKPKADQGPKQTSSESQVAAREKPKAKPKIAQVESTKPPSAAPARSASKATELAKADMKDPPKEFWEPKGKPASSTSEPMTERGKPAASPKPVKPAEPAPTPTVVAEASALVKQRLAEMKAEFEKSRESLLNREYYPKADTLKQQYTAAIQRSLDAAESASNTALVQAMQAELERLSENRSIPDRDPADTPEDLVQLRTTFRTHHSSIRNALPSLLLPLYDTHLKKLDQLKTELLQVNRSSDAMFVDLTVEDVRSERASLK